ncbi:MAG: anti-sigma regulatory factor [Fidelibacterota bacterium]
MTGIQFDTAMESNRINHRLNKSVIIPVTGEHHISKARMASISLANELGMSRIIAYYIGTSVSELSSNLFFHCPKGGTITLTPIYQSNKVGLEIISEDSGPGVPDIKLAMEDGFTTNKGLGSGLPGVRRLMDEFNIISTVGEGTKIVTRKWQI